MFCLTVFIQGIFSFLTIEELELIHTYILTYIHTYIHTYIIINIANGLVNIKITNTGTY